MIYGCYVWYVMWFLEWLWVRWGYEEIKLWLSEIGLLGKFIKLLNGSWM